MTSRVSKFLSLVAVSVLFSGRALAQQAQASVSSANTTIAYGTAFTPPYYGGSGTGNWQFCIGGYTNWNPQPNGPAGTNLVNGTWATSWSAPAVGSYGFYIAKCGDNTYANSNFSGWWTLTVNPAPMADPYFSPNPGSYTIYTNQAWNGPGMGAPASNGTGQLLWCASGGNNWTAGSWTPTRPGTYSLYVAQKADSNHTGNVSDPTQGPIQVNYTAVTLNVIKQNQAGVSASVSPNPVAIGSGTTFSASGGSGTGAYSWSGAVSGTGSSMSTSFGTAGTYTATVYRLGDSTYNDSSSTSVSVTVNPYLTVNSGSGSGLYSPGAGASISANSPASNQVFSNWSSGSGSFANSTSISTTYTMPSTNASVTANYRGVTWTWVAPNSVSSGSGYSVSAYNNEGGMPYVSLYKNGAYVAGAWYEPTYTSPGDGPGSISYSSTYSDSMYSSSGSSSWTVNVITSPPSISSQPSSQTVNAGNSVTFSVTASTTYGSLSYQWYFNGSPISGATGTSYTIANAQAGNAGSYSVNVSNSGGTTSSNTATLTVNTPSAPSISVQPSSRSATQGTTTTFSVTASGNPSPGYQWYFNSNAISGATGASYSIASVQPSNAGTYYVVVSNGVLPNATSSSATLTVASPPVITSATTANGTAGSAFSYQIAASNSPSSYGASALPSGLTVNTSSGLISGTPTQSGTFTIGLTASNSAGSSTASLTLSVAAPPPTYTLSTSASPAAGGTVAGGGSYVAGSVVQVTANPNPGYAFLGWSGALTGNTNPATLTVNTSMTLSASFIPVVSGATNVPVLITIMSNGPGNVTINTGQSTDTFTFSGTAGQWQQPTSSTNNGFGWTLLNTNLGVLNSVTATATSTNAFIITATIESERARNLNASVELNGYLTGSIQSGEITGAGGAFTLKAVANGQVPFAMVDTSKLEVNRILTFGMGGNRSGLTAGRVVLSTGNWVYGGGSTNVEIIDGPAEINRWSSSPTHFQAQVPEGYIDVSENSGSTTVAYYGPGSYTVTNGYNDFSASTAIATYVITGSIAAPGNGTQGAGSISRTISGIKDVLEFTTQSTYTQGSNQTSTSGSTTVTTRHDTYDSVAQFWTWHVDGKVRTGLTVVEGTSSRTGVQFDNNPMNFQYDPSTVTVTRHDGPATSDIVDSYERHEFNVGDLALTGPHFIARGQGSENHYVTGTSYGDATYKIRPIISRNSTGGGTLTTYLSYSADGFTTNLGANDPIFTIGQPSSTRRSFLDDAVNSPTDLITTYTYNPDLVDDKPVVKTAVTTQNGATVGSLSYTYATGTFDNLATITTTATSHTDAAGTLTTTTKAYGGRFADLDRRGKPISIANPDGTQVSFAYQSVTYDTTAHTWSTTGPDLLVAELHGKQNAAGAVQNYAGAKVDALDMDPNRSTVTERIFDAKGQLRREATFVYQGGSTFAQLNATWFDYDALGHLTLKEDSSGRVLYKATYTGLHKDSETDEQGTTITYTYDDYERVLTATRADATAGTNTVPGETTTYGYDKIGRLASETVSGKGVPVGGETLATTYTYDTSDRPLSRTTPGGFTTSFSYPLRTDQFNLYNAETDATLPGGGTKIEKQYADGRVSSVSGSAVPDVTTTYSFDATTGDLLTTQTPLVGPTMKTTTDWVGRVASVSTDTWSGGSRVVTNTYNGLGQLAEQDTKSNGTSIAPAHLFHYDNYGRMDMEGSSTSGTGAISPTTDYAVKQYDSIYQIGAPGYSTNVYRHDSVRIWPYDGTNASTSRLASETYTQVTGLGATAAAHVLAIDVDRNSTDTTSIIDSTSHTTTTTAALELASTSTTSTTAGGNTTITSSTTVTALTPAITSVNAGGLEVSSTNAQNLTTTRTYDALRRLHTSVDPRIGATTYVYISGSTLPNTVTTPDTRTTTFGYDTAGRVSSKKDNPDIKGVSKSANFQYDAAGNLTYQWGDTVSPVHFEYNDANQQTKMHTYRSGTWSTSTLPSDFTGVGDVTTWNYKAGLLDSKVDNSSATTSYQYNDLGQITQRTDARNWITTYGYDAVGLLHTVTYGTNANTVTTNLTYTYTRAGQLLTVIDATGTRTFAYYDSGTNINGVTSTNKDGATDDGDLLNKSDRLKSETLDATWYGGHVLTYTYYYGAAGKANGSISALSLNTATAYNLTYDYDSVLRLNKLTYNNSATPFNYTYVTNGNLVGTVTHGAAAYLGYDYEPTGNRLATVKASWGGIGPVETRVTREPNVPLINTEKTQGTDYLAAIARSTLSGVDTEFGYTDRYEINSSGKYPIDSSWNLTSQTPLGGTSVAYPYDAFGNRSSATSPVWTPNALNQYSETPNSTSYAYDANGNMTSDGTRTYAYDAENRLISVTQGSSAWTYVYDYLGRRVEKSGTGIATTKFLYDGWNVIAELDGTATMARRFVWGLDAAGSLSAAGGVGGLLQIDADGANEYYPIYDASFNVLGLYNNGGSISGGAAYEYDPFGNVVTTSAGTYATANPFRSATKYTDAETGFVYYGRRFYSPTLGRFINRDPVEEQGGLNLYAFCGNDDVNKYDPLGLFSQDDARKAANMVRDAAESAARAAALDRGGVLGMALSSLNGEDLNAGVAAYNGALSLLASPATSQNWAAQGSLQGAIDAGRLDLAAGIATDWNSRSSEISAYNAPSFGQQIAGWARGASSAIYGVASMLGHPIDAYNSARTVREPLTPYGSAVDNWLVHKRFQLNSAYGIGEISGETAIAVATWRVGSILSESVGAFRAGLAAETRPALELLGRDGLDIGEARAGMTFEDLRAAGYSYTERMSKARFAKEFADVPTEGLRNTLIDYVNIEGDNYIVGGNSRLRAGIQYNLTDNLTFREVQLPYQNYETIDDVIQASLNYRGR